MPQETDSPASTDTRVDASAAVARPGRGALAAAVEAFALVMGGAALFALAPERAAWTAVVGGGVLLAVIVGVLRGTRAAPTAEAAAPRTPGSLVLPRQVLPVWNRSLALVREHSERDATQLLESFARVTATLDQALGGNSAPPVVELAAADRLLELHAPEIDRLLASTRQAVQLKDDLLAGVQAMAAELEQMTALTAEIQSVARATHLLALNASVEATRGAQGGAGFKVVAEQVRELASQSRQVGQQLTRRVNAMQESARTLKDKVRRENTDPDEIKMQAEENARAVLVALVGSLSEFTHSSRALRDSSREVQAELERILMGLQGQDRLSQMLMAVSADMDRMSAWIDGDGDPTATAPARWLERLEASYTMEEQRSSHHDMKAVEPDAAVEFF